jgi:regulatory protein
MEGGMAGVITALVVQEKNKERVNVFIDGEFALGLAMIEALKLHKGDRLADSDIEHLKGLDEIEVAHEYALNFLSYRPRSTAEVRRRMAERKVSQAAIDRVIERLTSTGLLDDEEFAKYWIANRKQSAPRGVKALKYELRQKGISDVTIADVVAEVDESDSAYRAALPIARRSAALDQRLFVKRVGDFLMRRGFNYSTARDVVRRLWEEVGENTDDTNNDNLTSALGD